MKKYTANELYRFVGRADTKEKIEIAERFIEKLDYLDNDLFDELMRALSYNYRELRYKERERYTKRYPV